jgi:alpha-tubulin suppressor-like RCC1 family protein
MSNFKFAVRDNNGNGTSQIVDFENVFVKQKFFSSSGLYSHGNNANGQLGSGTITHRSSPVQVGALTDWKQISTGSLSTLAIKKDGTLWSWGFNSNGELGQNDRTHRSSPVQVGALTNWKYVIITGYHALALKTDGSL